MLRWGLLGTARIADRMAASVAASSRSVVTCVASRDPERAARFARRRDVARSVGTYEDLLADAEVDLVYIPLPNDAHHEWILRSIAAGKHVLCEKPFVLSGSEMDEVIGAAEQSGLVVQEASMMRLHEQTRRVRDEVASGRLGQVQAGAGLFTIDLPVDPTNIRWDPERGGGALWDLGCYPVTFFNYVLGDRPREVVGRMIREEQGVDATFSGEIHYTGGAVATLLVSFLGVPAWSATLIGDYGRLSVSYPWLSRVGVDSVVEIGSRPADDSNIGAFGDDDLALTTVTVDFRGVDAYFGEVLTMEGAILDGESTGFDLEETRTNVEVLEALYRSAASGVPISL